VTPDDLVAVISDGIHTAIRSGRISAEVPDEIRVERPRHRGRGDYSTNVALRLAKSAGLPARTVAETLAPLVSGAAGVARAEAAGPGFVNITLETAAIGSLARDIVLAGDSYGRTDRLGGLRINLEFVSANPTGPVHIGGARWAVVGDVLARLLEAAGADVSREYYFNDAGVQIDRFVRSLLAAAHGTPVPEDGYSGAYIEEIAAAVLHRRPGTLDLPAPERYAVFRTVGTELTRAHPALRRTAQGEGSRDRQRSPGGLRPRLAHPRAGGGAAAHARRVPAGRDHRGHAARAAPGAALPGVAGRRVPPLLRRLPRPAAGR
jgi:arginyl-tRNA synthetase